MDEIHPSFPSVAAALCRPNSLTGFMLCRKAEGRCVQRNKCRAEFQLLLAAHMVLSRSVMHQNINGSGLSKYFPLLMLFWGGREGKENERKGKERTSFGTQCFKIVTSGMTKQPRNAANQHLYF